MWLNNLRMESKQNLIMKNLVPLPQNKLMPRKYFMKKMRKNPTSKSGWTKRKKRRGEKESNQKMKANPKRKKIQKRRFMRVKKRKMTASLKEKVFPSPWNPPQILIKKTNWWSLEWREMRRTNTNTTPSWKEKEFGLTGSSSSRSTLMNFVNSMRIGFPSMRTANDFYGVIYK